MAVALRKSRRGIDAAVASWPEVRSGLTASATLLRATRDQLDEVVEHRTEYEAARELVEGLSGEFAGLLAGLADGLDARLDREDRTLAEMAAGLTQVDEALPAYSTALERCVVIGRLMAWLIAAVAGLHGSCLILSDLLAGHRTSTGRSEPSKSDRPGLAAE